MSPEPIAPDPIAAALRTIEAEIRRRAADPSDQLQRGYQEWIKNHDIEQEDYPGAPAAWDILQMAAAYIQSCYEAEEGERDNIS